MTFTRCTSCAERQSNNVGVEASLCPGCRANKQEIERLRAVGLDVIDGKLDAEQRRDTALDRIAQLEALLSNPLIDIALGIVASDVPPYDREPHAAELREAIRAALAKESKS